MHQINLIARVGFNERAAEAVQVANQILQLRVYGGNDRLELLELTKNMKGSTLTICRLKISTIESFWL